MSKKSPSLLGVGVGDDNEKIVKKHCTKYFLSTFSILYLLYHYTRRVNNLLSRTLLLTSALGIY